MRDLSLVPTADLLDSLFSRYDNAVFHGTLARPMHKDDPTKIYSIRTAGDQYYAIGLAHAIIAFCHESMDETKSDLDPKDL